MPQNDDDRSDIALIEAAAAGDEPAFETIYYRYRDWILSVALRFTARPEDAQDVLQNTFMYLARKLPGLRLTGRLTTFLYPVVKHLAMEETRRRKLRRIEAEVLGDVDAFADEGPESSDPAPVEGDLRMVMARLPTIQREVVLLRFVDDLSLQEIADALSVPLGTVKSRLHHAIAALRQDAVTRRYFLNE